MSSERSALSKKTAISLLILIVLVFPAVYNHNAQAQTATFLYLDEPASYSIVAGQDIAFTGYFITANDEVIEGATIEIYAYDADENTWLIGTAETDSNGEFQAAWTVEYLADYIGIFAYFAEQEDLGEAYSESYIVSITEESPVITEQVEISMSPNKDSYAIGETVLIDAFLSPIVADEDPYIIIYNGYDWIYSEGFVQPDPDGNFSFEFDIAGKHAIPGDWIINVEYLDATKFMTFSVTQAEDDDYITLDPYEVEFDGQVFTFYAGLSNGEIGDIFVDMESATMELHIDTQFYEGELVVELPRELIDAKTLNGDDDYFIVFDGEYETDYIESETTETSRTLHVFVDGYSSLITIVGTSVSSEEISEVETILTLDEVPSKVAQGEAIVFTGSIYTVNNEPIEGALIYILDDDGGEYAEILAYGLTDSEGNFNIILALDPIDSDNKLLVYAYFEGGNDLEGSWLSESFSAEEYEVAISEKTIHTEPEFPDAYMTLFGVWDHDPIRVAIINLNNQASPEQQEAVEFAFNEWSRALKQASGNTQGFNFEVVRDSKINVFNAPPDIIVEIKFFDEEVSCNQALGYANPSPFVNPITGRFSDTIPSVVFGGCEGRIYSPDVIKATAIHELAHAFGVGHTFNKDGDLMCSTENTVNTCEQFPADDYYVISDLNIDAAISIYGNDGFAEPNVNPVPSIYAPEDNSEFFYITASTDKESYSNGDIAKITVEVFDSRGHPVDIEPSLIGISDEITSLDKGKYYFETEVKDGINGFTIAAGESKLGLSIVGEAVTSVPVTDEPTPISTEEKQPPSSDSSNTQGGGGCLIATAAFGSELTPQVQFLRGFRDNHILSTAAGSSFMNVFNSWYYSFSPYVADYERQQPWLQQTVKVAIYPLLGILHVSEKAYSSIPGEYGALSAGMIASAMIGAVYVSPIAVSIKQIRTSKFNYRMAISLIAAASFAVVVSILIVNQTALMVTTSLFVLAVISVTAILSVKSLIKISKYVSSVLQRSSQDKKS